MHFGAFELTGSILPELPPNFHTASRVSLLTHSDASFGFLPPTHSYDTTYMKTSNLSDDNSKSSFFIYFVFRGTYIFFHLTLNKMEVYISLVL